MRCRRVPLQECVEGNKMILSIVGVHSSSSSSKGDDMLRGKVGVEAFRERAVRAEGRGNNSTNAIWLYSIDISSF